MFIRCVTSILRWHIHERLARDIPAISFQGCVSTENFFSLSKKLYSWPRRVLKQFWEKKKDFMIGYIKDIMIILFD